MNKNVSQNFLLLKDYEQIQIIQYLSKDFRKRNLFNHFQYLYTLKIQYLKNLKRNEPIHKPQHKIQPKIAPIKQTQEPKEKPKEKKEVPVEAPKPEFNGVVSFDEMRPVVDPYLALRQDRVMARQQRVKSLISQAI